jgi:hypothetical protein
LVTPYKVLGANYGFLIDIPFAIADASGAAALEPVLSDSLGSVTFPSLQRSVGATKGSIGNIYFEPIDLGCISANSMPSWLADFSRLPAPTTQKQS